MNDANYRKLNDRSQNSSTYHKKDGTATRSILKREARKLETDQTQSEHTAAFLHQHAKANVESQLGDCCTGDEEIADLAEEAYALAFDAVFDLTGIIPLSHQIATNIRNEMYGDENVR